MAKIDDILRLAVSKKASDIHFSAQSPVMMRQHGDLIALTEKIYSDAELQEILLEIIDEKDRKKFFDNKNLDKSYSVPDCGNFRLNYFWSRRGVGAVIRWLPTRMPDIDDLGLPPVIKKLADLPKGLLLVTGPTGSGKSTTLAAIINYMNTNFSYHILTVEDPVEFVHPNKKSLINQREIGQSCMTFADALKYALREDPDVILVGEMRDQETIGLALTAAETGHLVLGTLHTRGAASAVDRIIESFPSSERPLIRAMLSESLRGVISQILLKAKEGHGRVAAYEIMVSNYAISNLIREGKTFQIQSILQTAKGEGMLQMEGHIRQLMAEGKVDPVEADAVLSSMVRASANQSSGGPTNPAGGAAVKVNVMEMPKPTSGKTGGPKAALKPEATAKTTKKPVEPAQKSAGPSVPPSVPNTAPPSAPPPVSRPTTKTTDLRPMGEEELPLVIERSNADKTVPGIRVQKVAKQSTPTEVPKAVAPAASSVTGSTSKTEASPRPPSVPVTPTAMPPKPPSVPPSAPLSASATAPAAPKTPPAAASAPVPPPRPQPAPSAPAVSKVASGTPPPPSTRSPVPKTPPPAAPPARVAAPAAPPARAPSPQSGPSTSTVSASTTAVKDVTKSSEVSAKKPAPRPPPAKKAG